MDLKRVRRVVGGIKSALFRNSNSFSIGMLKSHFKGSGLQFKEHRVYTHGDDVRFIDWKMLAKTQSPYIKTFEEERNVEIVVLLDATPSMLIGHNGISKLQAAIEITCLLYLIAKETNDFIHTIILTDKMTTLPNKNGDVGIVLLISALEKLNVLDEKGRINLSRVDSEELDGKLVVNNLLKHLSRRKEVVALSDFQESLALEDLSRVFFSSNLHCFQIISPIDENKKMPFHFFSRSNSIGKVTYTDGRRRKDENIQDINKRIKKINVKDRYLEEFVKEML
ncbi:MAG: DUF58 domain-containing protein [Halobacteriovoraceae bacterium]|nr:DUF58 domain-containing protein [Halobacteriovoraceae bacterium]